MKASDFLADPANWIKGCENYASDTGPCCMMGAVNREVHGNMAIAEKWKRLQDYLGVENLTDWNDAPERTHAEVLAALKACDL